MDLSNYFQKKGRGSAAALAQRINAPVPDMSCWANGVRPVPIHRAVAIEQATNGQVTRRDLRPKDWHLIWPELADSPVEIAAPAVRNDGVARNDAEVCP